MNDLQRSVKSRIELQDSSTGSRLSSTRMSRKVAIWFLAALIVSAMIVWFGFLGWGIIAILHWLLDSIENLWTAYF
jgi:type VI protein secretion system component VasF